SSRALGWAHIGSILHGHRLCDITDFEERPGRFWDRSWSAHSNYSSEGRLSGRYLLRNSPYELSHARSGRMVQAKEIRSTQTGPRRGREIASQDGRGANERYIQDYSKFNRDLYCRGLNIGGCVCQHRTGPQAYRGKNERRDESRSPWFR